MKTEFAAVVVLGALIVAQATAQPVGKPRTEPVETCAALAPPPPEFTGWAQPPNLAADLAAVLKEADLSQAQIVPGKPIMAKLSPVGEVRYRVPVQKADGPEVYGGLYRLKITQPGDYRVVAGAAPWMDLFKNATPVRAIGHGHGPPCTGLGKYVDFPLEPGDYLVQFSESLTPQTEILVALLPK